MKSTCKLQHFGSSGMTLVELVIAIAIASIIMLLFSIVYIHSTRFFYRQGIKASAIRQMLVAKYKIDRVIKPIKSITGIANNRWSYTCEGDTSPHNLFYSGDSLVDKGGVIASGLSMFSIEIMPVITDSSRALLIWEAQAGTKNWIGGAMAIAGTVRTHW